MTNEILSFKNQVENESGRLAPDLFLFFKKGLNKEKNVICSLDSVYVNIPQLAIQ